jgi:hypothetical protein
MHIRVALAGENQLCFKGDWTRREISALSTARTYGLNARKAVEVQDRGLMPSHGLLGVVGQINPIERHGDRSTTYVRSRRCRDRVESLGGFEIAAAQEKDQLIARRAQVRGDVLERRRKERGQPSLEAAFAGRILPLIGITGDIALMKRKLSSGR